MRHPESPLPLSRREAIGALAALGAASLLGPTVAAAHLPEPILTRAIPSSGELLPVIGLGSWITFNVGDDPQGAIAARE